MNIAFIINHSLTKVFFEVSSKLEENNIVAYWISPGNIEWIDWLKDRGVPSRRILDLRNAALNSKVLKEPNSEEMAELEKLTENTNLSINNIILGDRLLRDKPPDFAYRYLLEIYKYGYPFLKDNSIQYLFAEATWAVELIFSLIARKLSISFIAPAVVRIPAGRFSFFKDTTQKELFMNRKVESFHIKRAILFFEEYRKKGIKPKAFYINQKIPWIPSNLFKKIKRNIRLYFKLGDLDQTRPFFFLIDKKRLKTIIRAQIIRITKLFQPLCNDNEPFVLLSLHVQPESSIDVFAPHYFDQLWLVEQIVRSLPCTHKLYVREHSCGIGSREFYFFQRVKKMPNTFLVDPHIDSWEFIKKADVVITITGTSAYEAALLGTPAIIFSDLLFDQLPRIYRCRCIEDLKFQIREAIQMKDKPYSEQENQEIIKFLAYILANSFEAEYIDPVSDPNCMREENIKKIADAFLEFIKEAQV